MKLAAIDLGTNSFRLLVVEYKNGKFTELTRKLITTRLGEGITESKRLSEAAISRGIKAINDFSREIASHNVSAVNIVGTSALREVKNADDFTELVEQQLGCRPRIIGGREEAALIYRGVSHVFSEKKLFIIDIGGGSTEFIWSKKDKTGYESLNIGAVRLTEKYIDHPGSPLPEEDYQYIQSVVRKEIQPLKERNYSFKIVAGTGGTITTLAAIDRGIDSYEPQKIHGYHLTEETVDSILKKLRQSSWEERKAIKGLQPERADIITAGAIILSVIMKEMKIEDCAVSEYDILYGLLQEILEQD